MGLAGVRPKRPDEPYQRVEIAHADFPAGKGATRLDNGSGGFAPHLALNFMLPPGSAAGQYSMYRCSIALSEPPEIESALLTVCVVFSTSSGRRTLLVQ